MSEVRASAPAETSAPGMNGTSITNAGNHPERSIQTAWQCFYSVDGGGSLMTILGRTPDNPRHLLRQDTTLEPVNEHFIR
jgi:hypothetical protein